MKARSVGLAVLFTLGWGVIIHLCFGKSAAPIGVSLLSAGIPGGMFGVVTLVFWDGWRAKREEREMRRRYERAAKGEPR